MSKSTSPTLIFVQRRDGVRRAEYGSFVAVIVKKGRKWAVTVQVDGDLKGSVTRSTVGAARAYAQDLADVTDPTAFEGE